MEQIKRWSMNRLDYEIFEMEEEQWGDYVLFDDHENIVYELKEYINKLEKKIQRIEEIL